MIPQYNLFQNVYWIFSAESIGIGINNSDIWVQYESYIPAVGYCFYFFGGLFFLLLGVYLEKVLPTEFGSQKKPCFICMPSSYKCCRMKNQ